ncbi:sugar-binding protein [Streptomyces pluripotens]|uniref:Sugar-binding protein n=1 Tax=Streptomyces pluripotens TaxID=1355015 RepID=A0A221NXJ0_9ACTN|nr:MULTISPECIES: glutamate ABC transporter substrate-binding protein [Streptomyces]ARP70260.1 sugar-binding protein [Streptomyces pluripotens]ASN24518.1 sugar-binding protein [Streptomyces pluripotens]KIE28041.1 sugar-binding protein [Streptomyces sp. MUSC 125]MCH0558358.1 glutamate ABC transporter substrate-binding protein [Streptomyces sp. MUM 16J]
MFAARTRTSLRGWGGVGAMAVLCALAMAFALLLPCTQAAHRPVRAGQRVATGSQARAGDCTESQAQEQTLPPSGADGPTIDAIKARTGAKRKLVVGIDQNSYRWGYRNPNTEGAQLEGFDIDLVHRIAQDILGDPDAVQFKAIPTSQRIPAIQNGRVDMVVRTMTITCNRLTQVAFSAPYFKTGQQVLAPKSSRITGYDDSLAHKKICTATGSTAFIKLTADRKSGRLPASTDISTTVPNQLDCLVRLQLGEVDAVVTDGALAASQAAQDPTVELKGKAFTTEYYGVAMKKNASDLVRRVNRVLMDYRAHGWQESYDTWLSATLGKDSAASEPPAPRYLRAG